MIPVTFSSSVRPVLFLVALTAVVAGGLVVASNPTGPVVGPTATVPLYGAGLVQQAPTPPGQSVEERLTRLEAKIDKVLKIIEDAAAEEQKAGGGTAGPLP